MDELELLRKKLEREKKVRKQAEAILEKKALELYLTNERLIKSNENKDGLIQATSLALTTLLNYDSLQESIQKSLDVIGPVSNADRAIVYFNGNKKNNAPDANYYLWDKESRKPQFKELDQKSIGQFLNKLDSYFENPDSIFDFTYSTAGSLEKMVMDASGIKSGIFFPITLDNNFVGIFGFEYYDEGEKWSENEFSILKAFSIGITSALEKRARRYDIEVQQRFYENVLNSIPSDLVVFDNQHKYKFVNPTAIRNDDVRKWIIGKDDFDYVEYRDKPKSIAENRRANFNELVKGKEGISYEEKLITKDGEDEWKRRYMYPVLDKNNEEVEMVIGYAVDITDIKKTQNELTSISTRLSTLITSLNSGILLEDQDRRILVTNQNFCQIFAIPVPPKDLIGIDCTNSAEQSKHLILEEDEFVKRIDKIVKAKKIVLNEEIVFKDGSVFERDFIPIYNQKLYLGHLWEYRNITIKKESERLLIRAREEAEESKRLKQRFLANMSHEIRTPMNGVIGIVNLLERTLLDGDQKKYLDILRDSSEHLLHIINDILDVSKIEEGKLNLVKSPVQLDILIEGVIQNLKRRIEDKKLALEITGLEIFETHLMMDPVRIRQILLNILSNAIKFTHKGKIGVYCHKIRETSKHLKFNIKISDTGIGIPESGLQKIYNAFDQGGSDTITQYGGTGLGLNIVKDLVDKMNGTIDVTSKENEGSTFTITFELKKAEKETYKLNEKITDIFDSKALKGKKILVADDHEVNFTIANEILKIWGADVYYAKDGEEAINMVIEKELDLVLMDMQMPNIDGIEATKMIRMLDESKSIIPIVAMTAAALPEERERCLQSGMNDYISKPYSTEKLYEILLNLLSVDINKVRVNEVIQEVNNDKMLYDLYYLNELCGDNTKFVLEMINSFTNNMPEMLNEMVIAQKDDDLQKISEIAHKSKSMASYLGCNSLRELLVDIETMANDSENIDGLENQIVKANSTLSNIIEQLNKVEL